MKIATKCFLLIAVFASTTFTLANEPAIKTPAPVIHLVDNLDEKDDLGWCIDTLGRGFAERLQAHSCKPRGGDVQFSFNAETGQIQSVEFADFCMTNRPNDKTVFALETCNSDSTEQQFSYDATSREIRPQSNSSKCVVVGSTSSSAGPFMSRKLLLTDCSATDAEHKQWVIKE